MCYVGTGQKLSHWVASGIGLIWLPHQVRSVIGEKESVRQLSSDLTSLHAKSLFRWLLSLLIILLSCCSATPRKKIISRGVMPTAALLFVGHDSLKGSMNNFRENQVSVLRLPLRSWNERLIIYLFDKFWHKAFPLALFSSSTMNFISFAAPSLESFNASSSPRVLAELLCFCGWCFLSFWWF